MNVRIIGEQNHWTAALRSLLVEEGVSSSAAAIHEIEAAATLAGTAADDSPNAEDEHVVLFVSKSADWLWLDRLPSIVAVASWDAAGEGDEAGGVPIFPAHDAAGLSAYIRRCRRLSPPMYADIYEYDGCLL